MRKLVVSTCALVALACCVTMYQSHTARAADNAATVRHTFEYATLSRVGTNAAWYAPGDHRPTVKPWDLYKDLGGKENEDDFDNNKLLTQIGQQGWELVSVGDDQNSRTFYFKRPS